MYYELVSNVLNVLFLCCIVIWVDLSLNKKYSQYVLGVIFGLITIFVMIGHIVVEGRFYDFRLITMTMAGFIGGPVTAVIAALISSLYRYCAGGTGSMAGMTNIITFACFGIILGKHLRRSNQNGKKLLFWFMIGIIMALILFLLVVINTLWMSDPIAILKVVATPFLIITPLATTIIFNFYFWTHEFFGKASILNAIINCSPINLMIFDTHGPILLSKNLKIELKSYPFIERLFPLLYKNKTWPNTTELHHKEITTDDGRDFVAELSSFQMPNGRSACVAIINDVTEQKLSGEKLTKSQEEVSSILESMTDCFFAINRSFKFTYVNGAGEIAFGKSRDELLGKKITDVYRVNPTALFHYHEVMREKKSATFEILSEALGNKWLEMSVYPTETGMTCYFRDITSRKKTEKVLRESEDKFSKVFHGGPIMMTLATVEDGEVLDVNEAMCSGTGYTREEFIGHTSKELNFFVDMPQRQKLGKELLVQGRIDNAEIEFRTKSGEIRHGLSWSQLSYLDGRHCHITGLIDVTEQKRIQKEMAKMDRLNLVGQLAAGIAHEIRNPMTTVRGYLQLLGVKPEYSAQQSTFELMISELDRANSIITEFLSLAQTKQTELELQNLNDILDHLYPLLESDAFTHNKQIRFLLGKIPNLELNAKEISQLILNLTRNGLEAMEEGGCLTLESYLHDDKVVLVVEDDGCGIPPENNNKLGIPFFTTKDNGTGLGLATCYRIAESHNAKICVDSNSSGTTFYISFPIQDKELRKNNMIA